MRVVVRKIDGVRDVRVSLKDGVATIHFAPSNRVKVEQIWDAVQSNGFMPREAELRVRGALVQHGDTLALSVPGSEQLFALEGAPGVSSPLSDLRRLPRNTLVVVSGRVLKSKRAAAGAPLVLRVREFVAEQAKR